VEDGYGQDGEPPDVASGPKEPQKFEKRTLARLPWREISAEIMPNLFSFEFKGFFASKPEAQDAECTLLRGDGKFKHQ
jgi:hypothetical protein